MIENDIIFLLNTFAIDSFTMMGTVAVEIVDILKELGLSEDTVISRLQRQNCSMERFVNSLIRLSIYYFHYLRN